MIVAADGPSMVAVVVSRSLRQQTRTERVGSTSFDRRAEYRRRFERVCGFYPTKECIPILGLVVRIAAVPGGVWVWRV
jgi:hypothetical protein